MTAGHGTVTTAGESVHDRFFVVCAVAALGQSNHQNLPACGPTGIDIDSRVANLNRITATTQQGNHVAGVIPISSSILEHHISKFKAGGSVVSESDEAECRSARYILTLGPAAILHAKKVVQSVVDADSAPAKIQTYARVLNTPVSTDKDEALQQLNANPGLWIRLHPNTRSFVLPNLGVNAAD